MRTDHLSGIIIRNRELEMNSQYEVVKSKAKILMKSYRHLNPITNTKNNLIKPRDYSVLNIHLY